MSVTIEDVMATVVNYRIAVFQGDDTMTESALRTVRNAVKALVAQARDEEAEACAKLCDHIGNKPTEAYLDPFDCATAIRARIAGRTA